MPEIIVPLPQGFSLEDTAKTFAAYLMGQNALDPELFDVNGQHEFGPHHLEESNKFQLDIGNNYWLHQNDDKTARLTSRYDGPVIQAMFDLFRAVHLRS
jgi:hypothetical protein